MYQIIPKEKRVLSDMGDMSSYFLFSFAHYVDYQNMSFGNIRVFNDDMLKAKSGFPKHPHRFFEIMTLVLDGTVSHEDSLGNKQKISRYQVQVTNTANGIFHSEFNEEETDLKLYQIWFTPDSEALTPSYSTFSYDPKDLKNTLFTLASGIEKHPQELSSKVSVKRGIFDEGTTLKIESKNKIFIYITSGEVCINNTDILGEKDQLRSIGNTLELVFQQKTDFIVIESI